ncbi:MAG TPA: HAMP domain-containing sensor histidine kinase [Candidatus Limnocylindria bacterium]|nr:HAMP domain-containing sensor histidine kinase [Candidatus Limnocylindria bacterium]
MSLRRRLAIWYGAVVAIVLGASLTIAYVLHTDAHDSDVDRALFDLSTRARETVTAQLAGGSLDLGVLHATIDEPYGVWLFSGEAVLAATGRSDDAAFRDAGLAAVPDGWHTGWTVDGRVRSYAVSIPAGRVVTAAELSAIDASNAELRFTYVLLGLLGVGIGSALVSSVAASALRPVATLTAMAREIASSRDFRRRVALAGDPYDELVVLARTFDAMLASLDDAYRQQQRFLSDVSHELRTPLTVIRGHAELLATSDRDGSAGVDAATHIVRETARLARLVDELLILARSQAAESFVAREVSLDDVVMETFDEMRPLAEGRLHVRWLEHAVVGGEPDRLKQVVLALVDNALRYTPAPGRVDISLSNDGHDAVIRVEDEGIGIDVADLPRVFDRFYRAEGARRMNSAGSGLGLPIVRWIVERHGGSIELQGRQRARGTLATVRLPLAATSAPTEARGAVATQ